jgi:hypothetical protein
VKAAWVGWFVLGALGCSNLTESNGGVVALQLRIPSPAVVEQHDTLQLFAKALDIRGDSVAARILWQTPDDSLLQIVDDTLGLMTTDTTAGQARVQASVGSLRSDLVVLTLRPRSDTLRLTGVDSITVVAPDSVSDTLGVVIESQNPAGGVAGTSILYELIDPAAQGQVVLPNGQASYRVQTGVTGGPVSAVTVRRITATPPSVVHVRVSATRPSGTEVPGSGQQFVVLFQ